MLRVMKFHFVFYIAHPVIMCPGDCGGWSREPFTGCAQSNQAIAFDGLASSAVAK